jgi:tripartite-type tricarboxylate transporter receptor subunit TctC
MSHKRFFCLTLALALSLFSASGSHAELGSRTTFLVVPLSAGTGIDFLARSLSERLAKRLGSPVAVDDRPGASARIGTEYVTRAAPDGYTMLMTPGTILSDAAIHDRPDPTANLDPVILLTTGRNGLVVGPRIKVNSVKELVALAKAEPGKLLYSAASNGSVHTLAMEQFKYLTHTDIERVPFTSSNDALSYVVTGRVDMMMLPIAASAAFVQNGQIRMLAALSDKRSPLFPNVPTMPEAGYPLMTYESYYFLMAPRGTPKETVARLNKDLNEILHDPSFQPTLEKLALMPQGGSPEDLTRGLHAELQRLRELVQNTNMKEY